ncbi:MAG TPA: hypothetical protein VG097_01990, partial [Gemmata sp.]|nr:hypothetical protein [Gemmata sp.]
MLPESASASMTPGLASNICLADDEVFQIAFELSPPAEVYTDPRFERTLEPGTRESRLLSDAPWVRSFGRLELSLTTEGWKFPAPPVDYVPSPRLP